MISKYILKRSIIICVLFSVVSLFAPPAAHADTYDKFVGFLNELEGLGVNLPFTSQQLTDVKGLVQCLENAGNDDIQIAICIDQFEESSAGSEITSQTGIPSWVWKILDCYILYRTGDYWGLAYELGGVAVCIVLQVATGGSDICALFDELIQMANAIWDTAKALAEFFASVGGAAYEAVKDVGCALGIGGCDDGPSPPPESYIYSLVFGNRVAEGLAAREAISDADFDTFLNTLKENALHKPEPILSAPPPPDFWGIRDAIYNLFTLANVQKAAKIYVYNVNIQWTNDIANRVLSERAKVMDAYCSQQNVNNIIQAELSKYVPNSPWHPESPIIQKCISDLRYKYGFAHVDRWLLYSPVSQLGSQAGGLRPNIKSNYELGGKFYQRIKPELQNQVRQYVKNHYCTEFLGKLVAQSLEDHLNCIDLMEIFGEQSQCWVDTDAVGQEAVDKIVEAFKSRGSVMYSNDMYSQISIGKPKVSKNFIPIDTPNFAPKEFICYRPSHEYYFDYYNTIYFGNLPHPILKRTLKENPLYNKLKQDVQAAATQLNDGQNPPVFIIHDIDPLAVMTATIEEFDRVKKDDPNFNFGLPSTKPGFEYSKGRYKSPTIDGFSTPHIFFDDTPDDLFGQKPLPHLQKELDFIDPTDLVSGKFDRQDVMNPVSLQQQGINQNVTQNFKKDAMGVQAPAQQKVMSGSLPAGQVPQQKPQVGFKNGIQLQQSVSQAAKDTPNAPQTAIPMSLDLPDLMANAQLDVYRGKTRWNAVVNLSATDKQLKIPVLFTVQNSGKVSSGKCDILRTSSGKTLTKSSLKALAPEKAETVKATLELAPGTHVVVMMIDSANKVHESNESNNRYQITLNITEISHPKTINPALPATKNNPPLQIKAR